MNSALAATPSPIPLSYPADWDSDGPRIAVGPLNTIPHDLFGPILWDLSINDITSLASTNVLTFVAYISEPVAGTTPLACRSVIRAMRFAHANKDDEHATMLALRHITGQNVRMRPGLLGEMAQMLPGMAATRNGVVSKAWEAACAGTHNDWRLCANAEMPCAVAYLLEVADWRARFSTDRRTQKQANKEALNRMVRQPPTLWPALMQAFAERGMVVPSDVLATFVDTFPGYLPGISDLLAIKLATGLFDDVRRTDIKNTLYRLGVTTRQLRRIVMPRLAAIAVESLLLSSRSLTRASIRWDVNDEEFNVLLDKAYLRHQVIA